METHNIVSTPNITGNVGSCTTQKETMQTGRSLFVESHKDILTNSCTGQITEGPEYWNIPLGMGLFTTIFVFLGLWALMIYLSNR